MEVYADIDFEASITSRFVLLATVLELLAERRSRDAAALGLIDKWSNEAKEAGRSDLATAINPMREESITSSIRKLVRSRCEASECGAEQAEAMARTAGSLYGQRSAVVHAAATVSPNDVELFRRIVRHALLGSAEPGSFSRIVEKLNQRVRRPDYGSKDF